MANFIKGVQKFQDHAFPDNKALFEELAGGQSPEAMFITCSDSRIETAMLTQSMPGDLFVCRNAGNIVPPHRQDAGGVTATLEYAMEVLKVPHLVVCGHSGCGAMGGVLDPDAVTSLPHVSEWLGFSKPAKDELDKTMPDASAEERIERLTELNVELQLKNLKGHPSVAKRIAAGEVALHGWVYDIGTGAVTAYDEAQDKFLPLAEKYNL